VRDAVIYRVYHYAPQPARLWWEECLEAKRISQSPDRSILLQEIFPRIVDLLRDKKDPAILWIGCARCTKDYYRILESKGARCWTIDIDPRAWRWGRQGRHAVGDLRDLSAIYPEQRFDMILCNGVFGWGIDTKEAQLAATEAMAENTRPGGWIMLGWNTNKTEDPVADGIVTRGYRPTELPGFGQRFAVSGSTHVYDFLRRAEDASV
jgi:SAM-dependent methyltransferase